MEFSTAIAEFADMLTVGSEALKRLAEREESGGLPAPRIDLLRETGTSRSA